MTDLIVMLSAGKGTWGLVYKLIKSQEWDKIFVITNEFGKNNFNNEKNAELIVLDLDALTDKLIVDMSQSLKGKIRNFEVAVNLTSGSGNEHMALIQALLNIGLAIRFVGINNEKFVEY